MGISARRASALATLAATGLLPAAADAATRTYVVQLKAAPLASYTGGRAGLPATSPKETGDQAQHRHQRRRRVLRLPRRARARRARPRARRRAHRRLLRPRRL